MPVALPPQVTVIPRSATPPRTSPVNTGRAFIAILAERCPDAPVLVTSLDDFIAGVGGRQSYSYGYDWVDEFLHDGGSQVYIRPAQGPAASRAAKTLAGVSGNSHTVTAKDRGEYGNAFQVAVVNGPAGASTRVIQILDAAGNLLEQTSESATQAGLVQPLQRVTIAVSTGTGLPAVSAASALTGGSSDRTSVTDTQWQAALDAIPTELGCGQVAAPDWTTDNARAALFAHAAARNRTPVPDPPDVTSKAALQAAFAALYATSNGKRGGGYGPWIDIPSLAPGGAGRVVPPSALVCARMAETDTRVSPNQAAAGPRYGASRYATGVHAAISHDTIGGVNDAGDLYARGVNLITNVGGLITIDGNRTFADPAGVDGVLSQVSVARYVMWTIARLYELGSNEKFLRVTRAAIAAFNVDVTALLLRDYGNDDLFGDIDDDRPETAFAVDTTTPNTPQTIQAGQLNVLAAVRPARGADYVNFGLSILPVTSPVR